MNLGENIYRLRAEKNMSQGDLADALGVSRQSVSKWENNSAVPELDKLIKMTEIFSISLDTLVRDPTDQEPPAPEAPSATPTPITIPDDIPKTSGTVPGFVFLFVAVALLLLFALKTHFLTAILYTLPLFVCSALCFILNRRRGLWCCWVLLFSAVSMIYAGTGIELQPFWGMLSLLSGFPTGLYRFLMALAINTAVAGMSYWSLRCYITAAINHAAAKKTRLLLGWTMTFIPQILGGVLSSFAILVSAEGQLTPVFYLFRWFAYSASWLHLAAVLTMLIFTIARFRQLQMGFRPE